MISLVIVYCLAADQTHCVEKRDPFDPPPSQMACMVSAQMIAQHYVQEHPMWKLSRWRCEVDVPQSEGI